MLTAQKSRKHSLASQGVAVTRKMFRGNIPSKARKAYGANDYQALIPEFWAYETLRVMSEKMVGVNLIHRDFENEIKAFGETVNTRKPNTFTASRKLPGGEVVAQDAVATNVAVVLNQQAYTSFLIDDVSISKSFLDVAALFAEPAALALAQQIDRTILGQYHRFIGQSYGGLGQMSTSNSVDYLIGAREKAETLLWPGENRHLIFGSRAESKILGTNLFNQANTSGNGGMTQMTGQMGDRFGFNLYGCQNTPSVTNTIPTSAGAVNLSGGYAAGTTTMVVDDITGEIAVGTWFTVAGDYTPQRVTAHTETSTNTTGITFSPGLQNAVANDAVITFIVPGAVNLVAGYDAGHVGSIKFDGTSSAVPKVGQLVSFGLGTAPTLYTVLKVTGADTFEVDRPLVAALANDDAVNFGPGGGYNMFFSRNALAFVNRPMAQPMAGAGAVSAVKDYKGLSIRVTISYDSTYEQHRVTLGMLYGIAGLDTTLGGVLYS